MLPMRVFYIHVSGFLTEWSKSKKVLKTMKLDMQFLDHHRQQFLDLHAELSKIVEDVIHWIKAASKARLV